MQFWQARQELLRKVRKYLWNYFASRKKVSPSSKRQKVYEFIGDGNWTRQIWEYAVRKLLSESKTESFSSTPFPVFCKNIRIYYLISVSFHSKRFHSRTFDNFTELFFAHFPFFSAQSPKLIGKIYSVQKVIFPQNVRLTT